MGVQTDFIIARSRAALPKMLAAAPTSERAKIHENYRKVSTSPQGTYALIDYVNFKGDGTSPTEKYKGQGWGLLQVLGGMNNVPAGPAAASEFAQAHPEFVLEQPAWLFNESGLSRNLTHWPGAYLRRL